MKLFACHLVAVAAAAAEVYEVGPGKPFEKIGDAPLAALAPGDTVRVYWRPEPYREKFVLCRQGAADAPITLRGVPGPEGQLPVIDARDAVTASTLNYWRENRGVIKIGGANVPADVMPRHIVIDSLEIRSARPPYRFTDRFGQAQTYAVNAAAIDVEKGESLTIRNCILHDSGNGLFIGSSEENLTRDVLIEANWIHSNGIEASALHHNAYTEALGIVYQFNYFGPPRPGSLGNNLKDRSAGLVVRYNWIEGGNRQLDLVDAGVASLRESPRYRETSAYGNILIEREGDGNRQIVHYGGDSAAPEAYRKGLLDFFNNTIVSLRERTTLFRLSTADEKCLARNNIFYAAVGGDTVELLNGEGELALSRNWFKPGRRAAFSGPPAGRILDDGSNLEGAEPGFAGEAGQDYRITPSSMVRDEGLAVDGLDMQYVRHQAGETRPRDGHVDLGAFEAVTSDSPQTGIRSRARFAGASAGTARPRRTSAGGR